MFALLYKKIYTFLFIDFDLSGLISLDLLGSYKFNK